MFDDEKKIKPSGWLNAEQRDTAISGYLLSRVLDYIKVDYIKENAQRGLSPIPSEAVAELSNKEMEKAEENGQCVEYITTWVRKWKIPIDVEGLIQTADSNPQRIIEDTLQLTEDLDKEE